MNILNTKNPKFEELISDEGCLIIGRAVLKKYGRKLNKDEKYQCYCIGLYNAIEIYPYNGSVKFETHLYNHVKYSILNYYRERSHIPIKDISTIQDINFDVVDVQLDLSDEERRLVNLYYFDRRSMTEAAKILGMSRSTFRRRLFKTLARLGDNGVSLNR